MAADRSTVLVIHHRARPECPHHARDPYVERYWTPPVGPTGIVLLRRFGLDAEAAPATSYPKHVIAHCLGVSVPTLDRTLERLSRFGFAHRVGFDEWDVDVLLPSVDPKHYKRLPRRLADELQGVAP